MHHKLTFGALALLGASVAQLMSCSSRSEQEQIGSSAQRVVTASTANTQITGTQYGQETSVAFASGISNPFTGINGTWVVGFNTFNDVSLFAGWAYSGDGSGTGWTVNAISGIHDFGDPGNSPFDGAAFGGWRGDPSVAAITDPTLSDGNKRLMYTMLACSHDCTELNDVVIALSTNGGVSWSNAAYVNGDSSHGGAHNTDNPWIASNPVSPYHSFVTWINDSGAWLAQVQYSNPTDGGPITFSATNYTQPPAPTGKTIDHPRISIGQFTDCGSNVHETVFLVFSTNFGRCAFDGMQHKGQQGYYLDVYDVPSNTWYGPFGLYATPSQWPNCVGGGTGGTTCATDGGPGAPFCADNDPRVHVAADYNSTNGAYFATFPIAGTHGTRIETISGTLGCDGSPTNHGHVDPNPCDPGPLGCTSTGPDGGPYIHDEWGPDVAFTYNGTTPRTVVTYYGTRSDTSNVQTNMYMYYSEDRGAHWTDPVAIGVAGTGQTVPWDYHLGDWSDYQSVAPNPDGGLLGAWGGDCRLGVNACNIFSTTFQ